MVYGLTVSYRGTGYSGWQRQPNAGTVQEQLETALAQLLGQPVRVVAAGRTDAGVHARGQVVHLDTGRELELGALVHGTNHVLPPDIRVLSAARMPSGFHARKCAAWKDYSYTVMAVRILSPLDSPYAVRVDPSLDFANIEAATRRLPGRHDFSAFALAGGSHTTSTRTLHAAGWRDDPGGRRTLLLRGEGFLRGMVRSIVGTLIEVGSGRRSVESFASLLDGRPRSEAGPTAPPEGLVLERVAYPEAWSPVESLGEFHTPPAEAGFEPSLW